MFSPRKIILLIILLITVSISAYVIVVVIPARLAAKSYEGAKQIGRDISQVFQFTPEIKINNTIVLQQQTPILELATVSQKFQHHYEWINTRLYSTKKISIAGTFEAKAGFDLQEKFIIDMNDNTATITIPHAEILSTELLGDVKFQDEHGVWNWIDHEDREAALDAFQHDARKYAAEAEFIEQAEVNIERDLRQILESHGKKMVIQFNDEKLNDLQ
jgi:hypothetical protein